MADAGTLAWLIPLLLVIVVLIVIFFLSNSVYIVRQAEGIVIERFGRFHAVLDSGLHFTVPFMDSPRLFNWKKTHIDANGRMIETLISGYRIDLRETVFNFPKQDVYSRDTVALNVNALMYYRIFDIKKALYEVDDLQGALSNTAQTQLKEVFGSMTFADALTSQDYINEHLSTSFSRLFASWGITVERMEILELSPHANIADAMKKQLMAERDRRGAAIQAEGQKTAKRLRADGERIVKMNMGLAEREATRKISEGDAQAKVALARAESTALGVVNQALMAEGSSRSQYFIAQEYLDFLKAMASNASSKMLYLPYVATGLSGMAANLEGVYGLNGLPPAAAVPRQHPAAGVGDNFDDLN